MTTFLGVTPQHNALNTLEKRIRSRMDPKLIVLSSLTEDEMREIMRRSLLIQRDDGDECDGHFVRYLELFNASVMEVFEVSEERRRSVTLLSSFSKSKRMKAVISHLYFRSRNVRTFLNLIVQCMRFVVFSPYTSSL